ncbi:hypothetical protein NERG_01883 [Nematocida ausubeli]|uniref:Uncharacterized protein n=1 Tax=Nematocida ausubeli (strain ATCC PRA-371 / ERTm2) TaxID=1913371 RepID=H8ZE62_NEMA1|nr:hypothetical protein NERG_01883 [Nematocida ausubeli]
MGSIERTHTEQGLRFRELLSLQRYIIRSENQEEVVINPEGPLNQLHAYMYRVNGIMHNKRFFSPEIDMHRCALVPSENESASLGCACTKENTEDRVHSELYQTGEMFEYTREYFTTLLRMFPSVDGHLSIHTSSKDSFFAFINSSRVSEHKYRILASLLLLTEGMPVQMLIEKSAESIHLTLRKMEDISAHFSISMGRECESGKERKEAQNPLKEGYTNEVAEVIRFFIQNGENRILKKEGHVIEPKLYSDFKLGMFLNTPGFLIQMYIYEYIDTVYGMQSFFESVHAILCEYMACTDKRLSSKAEQLFHKYFAPCSHVSAGVEYIETAAQILFYLNKEKLLPFFLNEQIKPMQGQSCYIRSVKSLESICKAQLSEIERACSAFSMGCTDNNSEKNYINCMEATALAMFCCFAYDQENQMYATDHLEAPSADLVRFFRVHRHMFKEAALGTYNAWNRVVADLDNPSICYISQNRNRLDTGLLNLLRVVTEVAGIYHKEKENIDKIEAAIKDCSYLEENMLDPHLTQEIQTYIETLFKSLSVRGHSFKTLSIKCGFFSPVITERGRVDVFGIVCMTYKSAAVEESICFEILPLFTGIKIMLARNILPDMSTNESLASLQKFPCLQGNAFIQFMLRHTIELSLRTHEASHTVMEYIKLGSSFAGRKRNSSMNCFLLAMQTEDELYILDLVRCLLVLAFDLNLRSPHYIIRFLSNMIAPRVVDIDLMHSGLATLILLAKAYKYFPHIKIDPAIYSKMDCVEVSRVLAYITEIDSPETMNRILLLLISANEAGIPGYIDRILICLPSVWRMKILICLTRSGRSAKYIYSILEAMKKIKRGSGAHNIIRRSNNLLITIISTLSEKKEESYTNILTECFGMIVVPEVGVLCNVPTVSLMLLNERVACFLSLKQRLRFLHLPENFAKFNIILSLYTQKIESIHKATAHINNHVQVHDW